jgi:hypothetical protein
VYPSRFEVQTLAKTVDIGLGCPEYGVEFCCGLAVHDGIVAVGLGVNDSEAIIAQFNETDIDRLLE